jgi:hypothetical protein
MVLRNRGECGRFEDFDFHSPIFIFIPFFFPLHFYVIFMFSVLPAYPGLEISVKASAGYYCQQDGFRIGEPGY